METPIQTTIPNPRPSSHLLLLLSLITIASLFASIFFFYQYSRLQKQLSQIQTTLSQSPIPTPSTSSTADWKTYTAEKLSLHFSAPSSLFVTINPEPNPSSSTIYIQSFPFNTPTPKGYFQLYLIAQSNPAPNTNTLANLKKDLDLTTETTIADSPAVSGYSISNRNRYITYFVRNKILYSVFVSETTPENIDLAKSILSTFRFTN